MTWRAYRIPFRRTFTTSAGAQTLREGFIVRLEADGGLYGLGEIAPLGIKSMQTVADRLRALQRRIPGVPIDDVAGVAERHGGGPQGIGAAFRCGLEIAACDLLARAGKVPIVALLGGRQRRRVPVNATISADTPELAAQSARSAVATGFRCVKLKVGMMGSIEAECELVGAVRDAIGPDTLLRVDANQAWDRKRAIATIKALECFGLEFVEQPVAADDLAGLAAVRCAVGTPIAADEAVTGVGAAIRIIQHDAADLLIIKPMVVGGLSPALAIISLTQSHGLEPVITTTIDSGVGIAAALHLAASFRGERACGLATAELLESDLTLSTPQPRDGQMACPDRPGLGVKIDEVKAAPYLYGL